MKITYIKLENVAGLMVGSNISKLEIDFNKSKNKIIAIQAPNGSGKSVLLSSLTPFAGVTSVDERSSLPYIISKKSGYKEIHYDMNGDKIIIKHYYKPNKEEGHTVKSYFSLNGEELNENGNVTSFLSLVEMHMGLTIEMMRLIRLGTNVNSFITLTPARRKEYIGKLIAEIDTYLKIYKKINEDIRVLKVLISSNNQNLSKCHISDIVVEEANLKNLNHEIKSLEKDRDKLVSKISKIQSLIKDNDIDDLRKKKQEAESSLNELNKTSDKIKELSLENVSIDSLIDKRNDLSNQKIDIRSKINSYRISIDSASKAIERLEVMIKKITSNNDIQSLVEAIETLRNSLSGARDIVVSFKPINDTTSEMISDMINKLSSFNQISNMIYTFGNRPIEIYLKLKRENKSVDAFLKDQMKKINSGINENDIKTLFDKLFEDDLIITPNCDTEYKDCPYYRFSDLILNLKDKLGTESFDGETLRYIQIISNNIDTILNTLDRMIKIGIPNSLKEDLCESSILKRLEKKLPFFDLSGLQEYLSLFREYEIFIRDKDKLKEYEYQLSIYKKSGVDTHISEINEYKKGITFYQNNISSLSKDIERINNDLETVDQEIGLVTKYNDGKKYESIFKSTLDTTNKILIPLESASNEKMELDFELRQIDENINRTRRDQKELETKIHEYKRLVVEGKKLDEKFKELNIILESTSTKKGIPVIYMQKYLGKIQKMANNLLKLIYDDNLQLSKFEVTPDSFEVPYVKNGKKIPDVKYSSQSEIALVTMALSFALSNKATGNYNILLLDEIDSGLDQNNRMAFLKMLYMQMDLLHAEQVFIISQNLDQMINVPMDVIRLSDTGVRSRLQNIIYDLQKEN